jgi:hypothetical protein
MGALVHKTTYAPMIYTALYVMLLMRADPLLRQVGGGWPWKSRLFWALEMDLLASKTLHRGPYKS